ncbi:YybH family protein [Flavobacterium sp. RHBU_24]|uniref:YybH family protein n=1 Tax=Flavobacterium sp. RHBU_24 TaxID=3391185 RepID=UPI0039851D9B
MRAKLISSIVFFILSIASNAQEPANSFENQTEQFNKAFIKAMMDGDMAECLSFFDDDIRLMPPFNPTIMDKAGADKYYKAFLDRFDIQKYERSTVHIEIIEDRRAIEIGNFKMQMGTKTTGEQKELNGKYLNIWELKNNRPKLITSIWNFNQDYGQFHKLLKFEGLPGIITAFQTQPPVDNPLMFELAALNLLHGLAVTQHDGPRWAQFYNEKTFLMPQYNDTCKGSTQVNQYIQAHVKELPVFEKLDIRNDKVEVAGAYVFEYASHVANWKTGEYSGVNTGKNLRIWKRQDDCSLKIVYHVSAYD